jgi:hypothetical protein
VYGRLVRTRATLLTMLAVVMLLGSVAPSGAAPSRLRSCSTNADFNLHISSARNMRCQTAKRDLRRHKGSIGFRFRTPGGFACMRVSGTSLGGQWRCVKGRKAYRFEFAD